MKRFRKGPTGQERPALTLWLTVHGKPHQCRSTSTMVFGVAHLVSSISRSMGLQPAGISSATPSSPGQKPPVYLRPGHVIHRSIECLGEQTQHVINFPEA